MGVLLTIHSQAPPACRRVGQSQSRKWRQKRKTRPGGQPDGSSYMGAWGGWALAPNTASMGRDYRSHPYWSRRGRPTFKRSAIFLTFWQEFYCPAGRTTSPEADLSDAIAVAGWSNARVGGWSEAF